MVRTWRWLVPVLMLAACKNTMGGHGSGGGSGLAAVTVSPATACLTVGQTVQLTANAIDSAGNVKPGVTASWGSSDVPVASVDQTGLVTGGALGSATITATVKGHNGTAGIALQSGTATATLRSMWGHLVVGDSGVMLHYNGTSWGPRCSGTTNALNANAVSAVGIPYALGAAGTILQLDTINGWWRFQASPTTNTLYGLARAPAAFMGTLFAVGAGGTILAYDGTTWTTQTSGISDTLFSVGKAPGNPVDFAVGAAGTILTYAKGTWNPQTSGTANDLYFVLVGDTNNVYAFGAAGTLLHYDGMKWSAIPVSGLTTALRAADVAVSATGAITDFFAVGDGGTILHSSDGVIWSRQTSGTANDLFRVWVDSASSVFAIGAVGTILHYDGTAWTKQR